MIALVMALVAVTHGRLDDGTSRLLVATTVGIDRISWMRVEQISKGLRIKSVWRFGGDKTGPWLRLEATSEKDGRLLEQRLSADRDLDANLLFLNPPKSEDRFFSLPKQSGDWILDGQHSKHVGTMDAAMRKAFLRTRSTALIHRHGARLLHIAFGRRFIQRDKSAADCFDFFFMVSEGHKVDVERWQNIGKKIYFCGPITDWPTPYRPNATRA